jgi:hypothetical protein
MASLSAGTCQTGFVTHAYETSATDEGESGTGEKKDGHTEAGRELQSEGHRPRQDEETRDGHP